MGQFTSLGGPDLACGPPTKYPWHHTHDMALWKTLVWLLFQFNGIQNSSPRKQIMNPNVNWRMSPVLFELSILPTNYCRCSAPGWFHRTIQTQHLKTHTKNHLTKKKDLGILRAAQQNWFHKFQFKQLNPPADLKLYSFYCSPTSSVVKTSNFREFMAITRHIPVMFSASAARKVQ